MQFKLIAIAAAALLASTVSHATVFGEVFDPAKFTLNEAADGTTTGTYQNNPVDIVIVLSGASASAKTIGTHIISDNCAAGALSVMWDSATGSNYRAYACDLSATNPINGGAAGSLVVIKRDSGGSIQGVNPIYVPGRISMMQLGTVVSAFGGSTTTPNNCTSTGNTASLNVPSYICPSTVQLFPDAGLSDVEPNIINDPINAGAGLSPVGTVTQRSVFQQMIGVATNLKLYRALQLSQGLTQDDAEANRPSLPSDFVSSLVLGKLSSSATAKRGWNLVVSAAADSNATTKQINVCRRVAGSGTQAAANIYFAGNPCSLGKINPLTAQGAIAVTGTVTAVVEGSSTGAVETCLGNVDALAGGPDNAAYAIGHIGRDNDPFSPSDKKYRFVKVNGFHPEAHPDVTTGKCDTTRNFAGCNDGQSGKYDYIFESTMQWNSGTPGNAAKVTYLNNIATKGFTAAQLQGNNAAVIAGVMALPTSYTGAFENLVLGSANQVYGSRVSRGSNSCSPLNVVR